MGGCRVNELTVSEQMVSHPLSYDLFEVIGVKKQRTEETMMHV